MQKLLGGCGNNGEFTLIYFVNTNATYGSYSTKNFGEEFIESAVIRNFNMDLKIQVPKERQLIKNATLYINIEKNLQKL